MATPAPENPALDEALDHALAPYVKLLTAAELAELRGVLARALAEDPIGSQMLRVLRTREVKHHSEDRVEPGAAQPSPDAASRGRKSRG